MKYLFLLQTKHYLEIIITSAKKGKYMLVKQGMSIAVSPALHLL